MTPSDLENFIAVAEAGSLTAAADALGSTRATVARRLSAVEQHLGVTLINRTTRELALTEAGRVYLDACRQGVASLRAAEDAVRELDGTPRGSLRIACPAIRPDHIVGPLIACYAAEHPQVNVQIHLTSERINPLTDGFDLAVQIGLERNASLVARCLSRETYRLVASPRCLERRGVPRAVGELAGHDCIVAVRAHRAPEHWVAAHMGPELVRASG
jgi:DNA-binding transcriptional LysR family regulator